jgi:hypothetical protein
VWHWLAVATAPMLAHELEVERALRREAEAQNVVYERMVAEFLEKGVETMDETQEQTGGVNIAAPAQKVVQVALGQVYQSVDAALATLDALEDLPYHAADTGIGLVHSTFEHAITELRAGLKQAAADAAVAVKQAGGVTTIGGGN